MNKIELINLICLTQDLESKFEYIQNGRPYYSLENIESVDSNEINELFKLDLLERTLEDLVLYSSDLFENTPIIQNGEVYGKIKKGESN